MNNSDLSASAASSLTETRFPKYIKYLVKRIEKGAAGTIINLNTVSFLNAEKPLPITVTIGYDRPTDREFLYIEPAAPSTTDYSSPLDGCTYNSLADPKLSAPCRGYFLRIFIKYKIYVPITIYEILEDPEFCSPDVEDGYRILVEDISHEAHKKFGIDFVKYYETFQNIIRGMPYLDPLEDNIDSLKNFEDFMDSDEEMSEEEIRNTKHALYEDTAHFLPWNFSSSATNHVGMRYQVSQKESISQKNRLILGESNFSFSVAFCKKHNNINQSKKIIATEYLEENALLSTHGNTFRDNITYLNSMEVEVKYGIDATNIHEIFQGYHFKYIHFNNPHDRKNYYVKDRTLPPLIANFFKSAYPLQNFGDKIYIALPINLDKHKQEEREGFIYKVYDAAASSGYKLVKKRRFDSARYPGYLHNMTGSATSAEIAKNCREYTFKKIEPLVDLPHTIYYKSPSEEKEFHKAKHYYDKGYILPDLETSDGSSSEEDIAPAASADTKTSSKKPVPVPKLDYAAAAKNALKPSSSNRPKFT